MPARRAPRRPGAGRRAGRGARDADRLDGGAARRPAPARAGARRPGAAAGGAGLAGAGRLGRARRRWRRRRRSSWRWSFAREVLVGLCLGFVASAAFRAAEIAGRLGDTLARREHRRDPGPDRRGALEPARRPLPPAGDAGLPADRRRAAPLRRAPRRATGCCRSAAASTPAPPAARRRVVTRRLGAPHRLGRRAGRAGDRRALADRSGARPGGARRAAGAGLLHRPAAQGAPGHRSRAALPRDAQAALAGDFGCLAAASPVGPRRRSELCCAPCPDPPASRPARSCSPALSPFLPLPRRRWPRGRPRRWRSISPRSRWAAGRSTT